MGCVVSKKAVSLTPAVESSGVLREHRQGSEVVLVHSSSRRHRAKEGLAKEEEGDRWDQGDSGKVSIKSTSRRVPRLALQWHRVLSLLSSSSAASSTPSPSSCCCSSSSPSLSGGVGFWPREMRKGIGRARIKASAEGSGGEHRRRGFASGGPAMEVSALASPSSSPLTTTTSTMVIDRSFGGGDSEFPVWDKLGACKLPRENQWEEREEKEGLAAACHLFLLHPLLASLNGEGERSLLPPPITISRSGKPPLPVSSMNS